MSKSDYGEKNQGQNSKILKSMNKMKIKLETQGYKGNILKPINQMKIKLKTQE